MPLGQHCKLNKIWYDAFKEHSLHFNAAVLLVANKRCEFSNLCLSLLQLIDRCTDVARRKNQSPEYIWVPCCLAQQKCG